MGQGRCGLNAIRRIADQHGTKVRFLLAGFFNTVLGLITYPTLYFLTAPLKLHYLTILAISQVICVSIAFLSNRFLVFHSSGNVLLEFGKFITFHLSYFLVNLAALPVMVEFVGMNPVWAQSLFAGLVIVSSYFWHSRITFSSTKAAN